jgi:hypothetical protein
MPFVRRHARVISGALPEAQRRGKTKKAGGAPKRSRRSANKAEADAANGTPGQTRKSGLTAAKKAEINAALLAKWEREGAGRQKDLGPKSGRSGGPPGKGVRRQPTAQPPGVVVRKFKPVGQLRLHSLRDHTRIYCVRCRQSKTASLVATMGGDWKRTVCERCYVSLIREQGEKERSTQGRRQPSRNLEVQRSKRTLTQSTAEKELQRLERRLPGVGRLLAFFRAAGVNVELAGDGYMLINGSQVELAWVLPSHTALDWDNVIDEMTLKYVRDKFAQAVAANAHFGEGLRCALQWRERGFMVTREDVRLAVIHATRAIIPHRQAIHGNFLVPGPHWQQVANVLRNAEPELVAQWKREQEAGTAAEAVAAMATAERRRAVARRRIDDLPNSLDPQLISACIDASRRIRLERQVAYERPVVLESDLGDLTLLPVIGTEGRLLMPFRLKKETETLTGELVLGDHDPLPLLIGDGVTDDDATTAWTCALLGFADATCVELEPTETPPRREPARQRRRPPTPVPQHRPSIQTLPRSRPWPRHLEPVGHWARYRGSFIAGHRRRLSDGQMASADARDRARQVGITLQPHETWVRPHTRGVPDGLEMRFLWHPPAELSRDHLQAKAKASQAPRR